MVQNNDILQFTPFATMQSDDVLNVFHYQYNTDAPVNPSLADVATAWGIEFDTRVVTHLSVQLLYNRLLVDNLTDGLEFSDGAYDASGDVTGEALPVHDAFSVKLIRSSKLTRNGRKSFAGVPENAQNSGAIVMDPLDVAEIEAFCGEPISLAIASITPDVVTLSPVIVGRTLDVNGVYQLDLTKINPVTDAIFSERIRTQRSRRRP